MEGTTADEAFTVGVLTLIVTRQVAVTDLTSLLSEGFFLEILADCGIQLREVGHGED